VSYPRAVAQADEYGHAVERELAYLVVHGVLHILGHDHERPEEQAIMRAREEAALAVVGLTRGT
jgi:probable rRNA maturation factor